MGIKKILIALSIVTTTLVTSFAPTFASCDEIEWVWSKYPDAWKIEWVSDGGDYDCGYAKVYETKGSCDYFTVQCQSLECNHSIDIETKSNPENIDIETKFIPENILTKYKNAHFMYDEGKNHYHIYPKDFKGELGLYDCSSKEVLIQFIIKDYGKDILTADKHYTGNNKGYINVYFKDGTFLKEEAFYVEVYENSKTYYVKGERYKVMEDKLKMEDKSKDEKKSN